MKKDKNCILTVDDALSKKNLQKDHHTMLPNLLEVTVGLSLFQKLFTCFYWYCIPTGSKFWQSLSSGQWCGFICFPSFNFGSNGLLKTTSRMDVMGW